MEIPDKYIKRLIRLAKKAEILLLIEGDDVSLDTYRVLVDLIGEVEALK